MDIFVILLIAVEAAFAYWLLYRAGLLDSFFRIAAAVLLLAAAFCLRVMVFDHVTYDYRDFLSGWVNYFRLNGGFSALRYSVGNYNIPYLYFLALFSYLPVNDLYLIKLLSVFFDVVLAWSVCRIVGMYRENSSWSFCAFFAVLFWPTVFLNGAYWAQCDSIYVAMAVLALWLMLTDRPRLAMAALAVSFGFKLQAVFIMPVFAVFLFRGKLRFRHLLWFPLTYVILVLPAVLAGRPFIDTITLYFHQTGSIGSGLNYNSPSLFAFWDRKAGLDTEAMSRSGIIAAFSFMLLVLALAFIKRKSPDRPCAMLLAAVLALGIPFLLPHMHDRYFFAADVLTLALAFLSPELAPCALLTESASFLGYYAYLNMRYLLVMSYGAVFILTALVCLIAAMLISAFRAPSGTASRCIEGARII